MKYFVSLLLMIACLPVFAQEGISFEQGDWKTVLAKAKQEDKLVFIDVFTSWCGPCKKMAAEVFPVKEVSELFNASFVNYKIDAEKGEGIQIAKAFSVHAYPTYLFVKGDGQLVYRFTGYTDAKLFLEQASTALKEKSDPKPLEKWNSEYEAGKRDKAFLLAYLKKRATLKLPSALILDQIAPLLSDNDYKNKEILSDILYYDSNAEYVPGGSFFTYVVAHYLTFDSLLGKSKGYSLRLMGSGIRNYFFKRIIPNNEENMLPLVINAGKEISQLLGENDIVASSRRWSMDYYDRTGNAKKLVVAAADYVNNGLLKLDLASMKAADEADYQKFMLPYLNGTADSLKNEHWSMLKRINLCRRLLNVSYQLRDAAEAIYHHTDDKKQLEQAAAWAKQANDLFMHFSNESVYAAILFKLGKTAEAIKLATHSSEDEILKSNDRLLKLFSDNIVLMKKGQAPDKIWRL